QTKSNRAAIDLRFQQCHTAGNRIKQQPGREKTEQRRNTQQQVDAGHARVHTAASEDAEADQPEAESHHKVRLSRVNRAEFQAGERENQQSTCDQVNLRKRSIDLAREEKRAHIALAWWWLQKNLRPGGAIFSQRHGRRPPKN